MNSVAWSARLPVASPARMFAGVFLGVFLIVFLGSVAVTFLLPKSYCATARLRVPDGADFRLLQSAELLKQVSRELDLPTQFAARYGEKRPLDEKRVEDLLRRSVQVQRVPATDFIEIRVYSRFPAECARWANEIAETGARQARGPIRIIDKATPPLRPSRPNKPLNLALGAVVGIVLGTMAGGVGAKLAVGFDGKCPPS